MQAEVNAKLPIVEGRFGVALGASYGKFGYEYGNSERDLSLSIAAQWRPTDSIEVIPFYDRYEATRAEAFPLVFVDGPREVGKTTLTTYRWRNRPPHFPCWPLAEEKQGLHANYRSPWTLGLVAALKKVDWLSTGFCHGC